MIITKNFAEHSKIAEETLKSLEKQIFDASKYMSECLESGGKILWCGNGGSATDSMHLSSELVGRFKNNRRSLRSISLASDSGNLTCISNDFGYENVFSRQIESLGNKGDILISLSTSGNSKNIIKAIKSANELNITTIAFLGKDGCKCIDLSNLDLKVPSESTARIQEMHMLIGHTLCELIEKKLKL